jgi:hypothetical protein
MMQSRRPVTGSALNITPATSASTMDCTTTAIDTSSGRMLRRLR